jgi:hypothetical protein
VAAQDVEAAAQIKPPGCYPRRHAPIEPSGLPAQRRYAAMFNQISFS